MTINHENLDQLVSSELVTIYNHFAVNVIKKFSDKKTALRRTDQIINDASPDQIKCFIIDHPPLAEKIDLKNPTPKLSDEVKHFNLRCASGDGYMLKTNKLCLDWARPVCPVCGSDMLTVQERRELKEKSGEKSN